jgi:hypothetical protein
MGGVVNRHVLAVRVDGDEVCVLARQVTDDSVRVEYIYHVLHTSFVSIKRIELEGRRLRVLERRLEYTALEREVYVTNYTYVDKMLSDEETKHIYDNLTIFLQYPSDFAYLFNRLTSEKTV